jgi:sterol desaturase/sphingolipid hydroxylase (fatty acid hydroxylase superfamily)
VVDGLTHALFEPARNVGALLLAPGSACSIAALLTSLAVFVVLLFRGKRARPVRLAVLRRAIFPRRLWRSASGRADLGYFAAGVLVLGVAVGWTVIASGVVRAGVAGVIGGPGAAALPPWLAATLATGAAFVAHEFGYWLDHWLKHRVPALWQFHKVHHQAESLSLLTNGRVHPVDTAIFHNILAVTAGVTTALVERVLGHDAAPFTVGGANLLVLGCAVAVTNLQHSHLWVTFGPRWGGWLLGPAHHQIHHSAAEAHFDRNLGSTLAVFDRVFGTFHRPAERREALRFGVDDEEHAPHSLRAASVQPFVGVARMTVRALPVREPRRSATSA